MQKIIYRETKSVVAKDRKLLFHLSRSARKRTLWLLRNVSTQISLRSPRKLIRADALRLRGVEV